MKLKKLFRNSAIENENAQAARMEVKPQPHQNMIQEKGGPVKKENFWNRNIRERAERKAEKDQPQPSLPVVPSSHLNQVASENQQAVTVLEPINAAQPVKAEEPVESGPEALTPVKQDNPDKSLIIEAPAPEDDSLSQPNVALPVPGPRASSQKAKIPPMQLIVAARSGNVSRVKSLLDAGADINGRGVNFQTPLIQAAKYKQTSVVQLLLERHANTVLRDGDEKSAEEYAVGDCLELLRTKRPKKWDGLLPEVKLQRGIQPDRSIITDYLPEELIAARADKIGAGNDHSEPFSSHLQPTTHPYGDIGRGTDPPSIIPLLPGIDSPAGIAPATFLDGLGLDEIVALCDRLGSSEFIRLFDSLGPDEQARLFDRLRLNISAANEPATISPNYPPAPRSDVQRGTGSTTLMERGEASQPRRNGGNGMILASYPAVNSRTSVAAVRARDIRSSDYTNPTHTASGERILAQYAVPGRIGSVEWVQERRQRGLL